LIEELTNIEESVLRGIMVRILDILGMAWEQITKISFTLGNLASGPQFAQITSSTETIGKIDMKVTLGDSSGSFQLCFPYPLLQPLIPRLAIERWFRKEVDLDKGAEISKALKERIASVEVPVVLEIGRTTISISEFLDLGVGDVIKLDSRYGKDLIVRVGGARKFQVRPGIVGRRLAFQVNHTVHDKGGVLG
jgi:flagellar motor switch protein FliM